MLERLPVAWQGKAHTDVRSVLRVVASSASVISKWENSDVMSQSEKQAAVAREEKEALLTTVYYEYSGPIHSYASRLLGNSEDADDITRMKTSCVMSSASSELPRGCLATRKLPMTSPKKSSFVCMGICLSYAIQLASSRGSTA